MKHVSYFRRSTKGSEKQDSRQHHISIPTKDAIAIVPPKKVIKALYDYTVDSPGYLSFTQGEFLHVVGREDDQDWYEACNPLVGTRGLVPVNHFDSIGKQAGRTGAAAQNLPLGKFEPVGPQRALSGGNNELSQQSFNQMPNNHVAQTTAPHHRTTPSITRQSGVMVYGIVQYDFKAERPDELDAKAGEAIIVIAQSNPEWFVAKPITRLGGPGLIPVSFIEIRDMTTGHAVTDTQSAVNRAGVPKVEEWKKMAANYKNSSIPLGKLGTPEDVTQNMERLSVSSAGRGHESTYGNTDSHTSYARTVNQQQQHQQQTSQQYPQQYPSSVRASQMLAPIRARVPRYQHNDIPKYWFIVEATMEDGKHWDLIREYGDFYALQCALMNDFPEAAGKDGHKRTLPYMPGPLPWVTERLTSERREHMDKYMASLLSMEQQIVYSQPVRTFFAPREQDIETDGNLDAHASNSSESEWVRLSQGSSQQSSAPRDSRQSSTGNLSNGGTGFTSPTKHAIAPIGSSSPYGNKQAPGHFRSTSDMRGGNGMAPNGHAGYSGNNNGGSISGVANMANGTAVKIKVWFGDSNCVVIRLPGNFNFTDLIHKLRERWRLEPGVEASTVNDTDFVVECKNESSGVYERMDGDYQLQQARERSDKLTLRVAAVMAV